MTTITEDLVLLLLDPRTGRPVVDRARLDRVIGGALLLDLTVRNRITSDGKGARVRLTVVDSAPTGDALLDGALARLGGRRRRPQNAVERLATGSRRSVLERLAARGLVRRRTTQVLGIFPTTTWPPLDPGRRAPLHGFLSAVLRDGAQPDPHVALLISLLHAVNAEHKVVTGPRRRLRARAREVSRGEWAGAAVHNAVQATHANVVLAVMVVTTLGRSAGKH